MSLQSLTLGCKVDRSQTYPAASYFSPYGDEGKNLNNQSIINARDDMAITFHTPCSF